MECSIEELARLMEAQKSENARLRSLVDRMGEAAWEAIAGVDSIRNSQGWDSPVYAGNLNSRPSIWWGEAIHRVEALRSLLEEWRKGKDAK